jgi:predicted nucleic acid-binding Zn ribbon protein
MPVFEALCSACNTLNEHFLRHWDSPDPPCSHCGGATERMASRFGVPLSGSLGKYMDLRREGADRGGFWAYKKRSSISGQPEPIFLDSMEAVKSFNRAEGLAAPGEVPTNASISADGKRLLSAGMPGNWQCGLPGIPTRLQEMIDIPAADCGPCPATASPAMPANYGITIEAVDAPPEMAG